MNVLLVDDHPLFIDGLRHLLSARGLNVVGIARDGLEALEQARSMRPDVILMDIQMPRLDGLAATRLIKAELPDVRIVMLTMFSNDENLFEAIKSGAFGYLVKTQDTDEFFRLLLGMQRGEAPLSSGLAARILQEFGRQSNGQGPRAVAEEEHTVLSSRQAQVLELVAQGLTYKEVGAKLHLAERTIKYHMGEIVQRLHVETRAQAVGRARATGMVALERAAP